MNTSNMNTNTSLMLPYPTLQGLRVPSGSSNAPSLSFTQDNRVGCYLPAPHTLAIVTDLSHRLTVTNQSVIVGETGNSCALEVNGDVVVNGNLALQSGSNVTLLTTPSNVIVQKQMVVSSD
jgi:hypothetical protein